MQPTNAAKNYISNTSRMSNSVPLRKPKLKLHVFMFLSIVTVMHLLSVDIKAGEPTLHDKWSGVLYFGKNI